MLDAVEHRLADRAVEAAERIGGVESYWTQSAFR